MEPVFQSARLLQAPRVWNSIRWVDQCVSSSFHSNTLSRKQVARVDQIISKGIISWQKIDSKSLYESTIAWMAIREENLSLI